MLRSLLANLRQLAGVILMVVGVGTMGQAALFCWVWRDGNPQVAATSAGLTAIGHFFEQFWPALLPGLPALVLGVWLAGPPWAWFRSGSAGGKGGSGAV
jgi:hypothetical protein